MALPSFLQPYLWSYDIKRMDKSRHKITIITSILNLGDEKAISWLFKTYSLSDIKDILKNPRRGMWHKTSLLYWQKILGVKAPRIVQEIAYINLNPDPALAKKILKSFKS